MAGKPRPIPLKARRAWEAGDEAGAEKLSGLKSRQLRNRLGPPGRAPASPAAVAGAGSAPSPADAPQPPPPPVEPPAGSQGPPSRPDPTTAEIEAVDTLDEARAILRDIRAKMPTADDVRYASLAEKALSAINRIEQIEAKRPRPPARDEVQEAIRGQMDGCVAFLLRHTREADAAFAKGRGALDVWAARNLGPALAAEHAGLVRAMFGEAA